MSDYYIAAKKDCFGDYLSEIGKYSILTKEEERKYGLRVKTMLNFQAKAKELGENASVEQIAEACGCTVSEYKRTINAGRVARERMLKHNLRLVVFVARKYNKCGVELEDLVQEGNVGLMRAVEKFNPELGYKFSTYACVPITTRILTQRGWLAWDEVRGGDATLGYDFDKQRLDWTRVIQVKDYDDAPVMRFGNRRWSTLCTANHKWLMNENGHSEMLPIEEWPLSGTSQVQLQLSAFYDSGKSKVSPSEAALIAWVLADGVVIVDRESVQDFKEVYVIDTNTERTADVRPLLYSLDCLDHKVEYGDNYTQLHLKLEDFKDIWQRAQLDRGSLLEAVFGFTAEARQAFNDAWLKSGSSNNKSSLLITHARNVDAVEVSLFLDGRSQMHEERLDQCALLTWRQEEITPELFAVVPAGRKRVWCPSTSLGSWVAKDENGHIFLTGNTWWIKQSIIRAVANQSRTIRLPVHIYDLLNKVKKTERTLSQMEGRRVRLREIASSLNVKIEKLQSLQQYAKNIWSLDSERYNTDDSFSITDSYYSPEEEEDKAFLEDMRARAFELLEMLDERERYIMIRRFGLDNDDPRSYKAIADELQISSQCVRNASFRIFNKLRKLCEEQELVFYERLS